MVNRVKSRILGFIMILLTFIFMTMVPELTRQRDGSLLVSLTSGVVDLVSSLLFGLCIVYCALCSLFMGMVGRSNL